jgi:hypothetical protein
MLREKVEARERQLASPRRKTTCTETITKRTARKQHLSPLCRVLDAVAEQRDVLNFRIWLADPDDTHLEADVQTWCKLSLALADFLDARREA